MSPTKMRSTLGLPKYQQIRKELHDAIGSGQYKVGSQLPPERELAKTFNVSPVTLRRALTSLTEEGLINRVQGVGTFVLRQEPSRDGVSPSMSSTRSIAWVLIETSSEHMPDYMGYNQAEARALHEHLAQRGYTLTVVYTNSKEFASGKLPFALTPGEIDGVILSGFVEDFHVHYLRSLGFPVVVAGNRPIHMPVSQIEINSCKHAYLATKSIMEATEGPVYFVTRPFDCYFSFQLLAGYSQAVSESNRVSRVVVLTYTGNDEQELREVLSEIKGPCGLFVNHNIAYELRSLYQELGWGFEDHPVAMISELHRLSPDIIRQMNVSSGNIDLQMEAAVELMVESLAGNTPRKVLLEPELSCTTEDGVLRIQTTHSAVTADDPATDVCAMVNDAAP